MIESWESMVTLGASEFIVDQKLIMKPVITDAMILL